MHVKMTVTRLKAAQPGDGSGLLDGQFEGYASVFGNVDSYGDVVEAGAFAETLAADFDDAHPIPLLWGHDFYDPMSNIGSATAVEDDHGLKVLGSFDLTDNPKAAQVYKLIKGGRVNQMSFAYDVLDGGPETVDGNTVFVIRKVKLYEVSIVPIGANAETEILAVKSLTRALASGVVDGPAGKAGRTISAKNEGDLRDARDAIDRVLSTLDNNDGEKASGQGRQQDEEPAGAKSSTPAVNPFAAELELRLRMSDLSGV